MTYDVVVLGLGGMGSAAALALARRGQRVLGLEQFGPAHALGSSHGGSRVYRQAYLEDPAYVPLLLRAWDRWHDLGPECFVPTGGLYVGPADGATFGAARQAAVQWDLPHEVLTPADVAARFPTFAVPAGELALYEERAGYARPEVTIATQLRLAAAAGADLRFDEPALSWTAPGGSWTAPDRSGTAPGGSWTAPGAGSGAGGPARSRGAVSVRTGAGTYEAGALVLTAGAWMPRLAGLDAPMVVERQVMHWVAPAGPIAPYERNPVFLAGEGAEQVYGFPAIDGPAGGVKVSFFRAGEPADPDTVDRTVRPAEVARLRARAREVLPGLTGESVRATVCLYTTTPDEHFVIGPHPDVPGVVVAGGFSGHGFKFVPVVGEILADLAVDGRTDAPVALFDPRRFRDR